MAAYIHDPRACLSTRLRFATAHSKASIFALQKCHGFTPPIITMLRKNPFVRRIKNFHCYQLILFIHGNMIPARSKNTIIKSRMTHKLTIYLFFHIFSYRLSRIKPSISYHTRQSPHISMYSCNIERARLIQAHFYIHQSNLPFVTPFLSSFVLFLF